MYFGTKLLLSMGKASELQGAKVCEAATLLITRNPSDLASVAYGGAAAKAAGCSVDLGSAADKVAQTLTTGYEVRRRYPILASSDYMEACMPLSSNHMHALYHLHRDR